MATKSKQRQAVAPTSSSATRRGPRGFRIGILGSGLMGEKLGTIFARAGHAVTFSYARSAKKLERLAREAGHGARAGTPRQAVEGADAVLLAVHWSRLDDVLAQAGDLGRTVVVTCSLPMSLADSELVVAHTSSGAEALAARVKPAPVVSAFGTVPSEVLFAVHAARGRSPRPSLLYCGDDRRARRVAVRLIRDVGFEPLDGGPLKNARYLEPFTLLVAHLAYEIPGGAALTYRFERRARVGKKG